MIDVGRVKEQVDCRDVIERDLGRPKYRGHSYTSYKCPLHNEQKGYSLAVYADHWQCFGKCNRGGDAITWLREYHNLSFQDACQQLTSGDLPQIVGQHPRQEKMQPLSEPPDALWQKAARQIVEQAQETLHSQQGQRAMRYLLEQRSLSAATILDAKLGYIPGHYLAWQTIHGLNVPCGITIPWEACGALWGIKVRRAAGEQRYQQVAGGNIKGCLYLADDIQPGMPILLTEGEFDALIARQAGVELISAAAIGSAANKRINRRWFTTFVSAPNILICMDADQAGEGAAAQISSLSQAARCVQVPQGKDLNDFYLIAGSATVRGWLSDHSVSYLAP
jgi:DNA primase